RLDTSRGQLRGGKRARRTSAQYGHFFHFFGTAGWPGGMVAGASPPAGGIAPCGFSPGGIAPPPCGLCPPARGFTTQRLPLRSSVYGIETGCPPPPPFGAKDTIASASFSLNVTDDTCTFMEATLRFWRPAR